MSSGVSLSKTLFIDPKTLPFGCYFVKNARRSPPTIIPRFTSFEDLQDFISLIIKDFQSANFPNQL
jgi:hypothetical protein